MKNTTGTHAGTPNTASASLPDNHSWVTGGPIESVFARPAGFRGRLAGRLMLRMNRQDEVLDHIGVEPGETVLEVGYGPGGLIRLLADRTKAATIIGVDPSADMRIAAARRNRAATRSGRVDLRLGRADRTGLSDRCIDRVVTVNTVALWPDLGAGVAELHRVVQPGGSVTLAWHGGTAPHRHAKPLILPAETLSRIEDALHGRFTVVRRTQLSTLEVFTAVR